MQIRFFCYLYRADHRLSRLFPDLPELFFALLPVQLCDINDILLQQCNDLIGICIDKNTDSPDTRIQLFFQLLRLLSCYIPLTFRI